ncbi:MAG: putative DNA-binding domain-containing protein [Deltaproteobacteria bacterium]|nr:putative DNA-binding domain-containing protein [Deltaproteobacteria bacterium]MBK8241273.1 putative DNA-binding domain-containing protein [Deltaproteobacteria bacterium]MBK8716802.1 putative DNA-binding domain-containing protein [Deltaproteobacteria bacterium]MBP7291716.1 putative DNA-binding domain-containing protein [Nannocystaceae bacterium]
MTEAALEGFFAHLRPMLLGHCSAAVTEVVLGPSPSGTANLGFYTTLVRRNLDKVLRDVFPATRAAIVHAATPAWDDVVSAYALAHPPTGSDPNRFGASFPSWIAAQPHGGATRWAQLADYEWLRVRAYHAPDVPDDADLVTKDGLERRLFVRQYSFDVPAVVEQYRRGEAMGDGDKPTLVFVFRHARTQALGVFRPKVAGLAALAERCGLPLPPLLAELEPAAIAAARSVLEQAGVLFEVEATSARARREPDEP